MTPAQRLLLRSSEIRSRLNELSGIATADLSDENRAEIERLTAEFKDVEMQHRAAIVAGSDGLETSTSTGGSEERELADLTRRSSIGEIFTGAIEHRAIEGATAELQEHYKVAGNAVPLALLRGDGDTGGNGIEERAVTPAPANVGATQAPIIPAVFPMSVAAFLSVDSPTVGVGEAVFPVLKTSATAHTPAENANAADTTGSFDAEVLTPARIQAAFFFSREDRARFAGMDESLRQNLSDALSDGLDKQVVSGSNGLLTGTNLANHTASAVTDYAAYLARFGYARVDGKYAATTGDLRAVMGSGTYSHAGNVYRNNTVDSPVLDRLMTLTGGIRVSAHVPAVVSNKQNAVIRLGMRRDMVAAIWEGISIIPDEVTKAGDGQIVITAVMLHAVKILRAAGFYKQETQHQ